MYLDDIQVVDESVTTNVGRDSQISDLLTLQPNPFNDWIALDLKYSLNEDAKIQVVDALGRILINQNILAQQEKVNLDLSNLSEGVYYLSLSYKNKVWSQKIIKN